MSAIYGFDPTTARPDLELAGRLAAGEEAAFDDFYRLHAARLYSLACRMCGDASRAEDLTQELLIHLLGRFGQFRGTARLSTWVYRVAMNFFISHLRRSPGYETTPVDGATAPLAGAEPTGPLLARLDLERAILQLPPGSRQVFLLHDVEGLRHREIAEILDISEGTSKSQLHHARMMLRCILKGDTP